MRNNNNTSMFTESTAGKTNSRAAHLLDTGATYEFSTFSQGDVKPGNLSLNLSQYRFD
jgi:hypothetical protein